jgi:hypothetical protein
VPTEAEKLTPASTGSRSTTSWQIAATATSSEGASWATAASGNPRKVATSRIREAGLDRNCFMVALSLLKEFITSDGLI